jgi:hypothetical protein
LSAALSTLDALGIMDERGETRRQHPYYFFELAQIIVRTAMSHQWFASSTASRNKMIRPSR